MLPVNFADKVVQWKEYLYVHQSCVTSTSFSKIREIYRQCREIKQLGPVELTLPENTALNNQFTDVEKKAHQLFFQFLRTEREGLGDVFRYNDMRSIFIKDNYQYLVRLYRGDDSATGQEIMKFPKVVRRHFFSSLGKIIGNLDYSGPQSLDNFFSQESYVPLSH